MIENTNKRQDTVNEMDRLLKSDEFRFANKAKLNRISLNTSNRTKTCSTRERYNTKAKQNKFHMNKSVMIPSTMFPKKISGITGISTYLYEVNSNPMKESLKTSCEKRSRKFKNTLNHYNNKLSSRRKIIGKFRYFTQSKSKNNYQNTSQVGSKKMKFSKNETIFEKFPPQLKGNISASVNYMKKNEKLRNNFINFKNLPNNLQYNMENRKTDMMHKRINRARSKQKKQYSSYFKNRDTIAFRIMSKLIEWPLQEKKISQNFKNFYWTRDFSHCAFANDKEIIDGYLPKP